LSAGSIVPDLQYDLELIAVSKSYDENAVVNDVSFAMKKGDFLSLLGPSGCGKTTTLSMIAGFETPTRGEIKIRNERIDDRPPERRNIGMVFQNYALFPHMKVAENIGFGLRMRGTPRAEIAQRVIESARLVKVEHLLERLPRQLSGGQQQRVALARALIVQPALLLLDEPFGALDRLLREEMQIEVRSLLKRLGITTVFVTHDQDEALSMSDRVAVMFAGNIEQIDMPQALYDSPRTELVAGFIGKATFIPGRLEGAPLRFVSPDGTFDVPATHAPPSSGDATYFLRPEAIRIATNAKHYQNEVSGSVIASTFFGDRKMILVGTPSDQRFLVAVDRSTGLEIGAPVRIGWMTEHAALFQGGLRQ
jgi:ABC-type Fe3+/spermidine/putrescine transport system ATPase subunit